MRSLFLSEKSDNDRGVFAEEIESRGCWLFVYTAVHGNYSSDTPALPAFRIQGRSHIRGKANFLATLDTE